MQSKLKSEWKLNWGWPLFTLIFLLSITYYINLFYSQGFNEEAIRLAIRTSARISAVLFSMAFGAAALHSLHQNPLSWWMRMNRRFLGVSFAVSHLMHLLFLILLQLNFDPIFYQRDFITLFGGGLAYVFIISMLLTSFSFFAEKTSSKNWKRLHTLGGYWILFLFSLNYFKSAVKTYDFIPLALMLLTVWLVRLKVTFQNK